MRLVVTGRNGQVVSALLQRARYHGVEVIALGRPELDLMDAASGIGHIASYRPDLIVSAAAYTAVDKAETDADAAQAINACAPGILAAFAAAHAIPIVHLSTDYVFDGTKSKPYVETDAVRPLGVYGATKLAGEHAIVAATSNHAILRTAWIYSPFGGNFVRTMLRLAAQCPELRVVDDQIGNPTSALDIADAIVGVSRSLLARPDDIALRGTFHLAGSGAASWAEFATEIFSVSKELGGPEANVRPISAADYPTPARRPANSQLNTQKLLYRHGIILPNWRTSTRQVITQLLKNPPDTTIAKES